MALNLGLYQNLATGIKAPETSLGDVVDVYRQAKQSKVDNEYKKAISQSTLYNIELSKEAKKEAKEKEGLDAIQKYQIDPILAAGESRRLSEDEVNSQIGDILNENTGMKERYGNDPYFYISEKGVAAELDDVLDADEIARYEQMDPRLKGLLKEGMNVRVKVDTKTGEPIGIKDIDREIEKDKNKEGDMFTRSQQVGLTKKFLGEGMSGPEAVAATQEVIELLSNDSGKDPVNEMAMSRLQKTLNRKLDAFEIQDAKERGYFNDLEKSEAVDPVDPVDPVGPSAANPVSDLKKGLDSIYKLLDKIPAYGPSADA